MIRTFLNVMRASARTYLYICMLIFCLSSDLKAQDSNPDQHFFETLYDIPVMQGLDELEDMALSFDKAGGRIAEAGASTDVLSDREVISFYKTALEQMGWRRVEGTYDPYQFTREDEHLSIFITKSGASTVYRFLLEPEMQ